MFADMYVYVHVYIQHHIQTQNDSGQPLSGPKKQSQKND